MGEEGRRGSGEERAAERGWVKREGRERRMRRREGGEGVGEERVSEKRERVGGEGE